jgi:hypothetical protein
VAQPLQPLPLQQEAAVAQPLQPVVLNIIILLLILMMMILSAIFREGLKDD